MCLKLPVKCIFKILNGAKLILLYQYIKLNVEKISFKNDGFAIIYMKLSPGSIFMRHFIFLCFQL